MKTTIPAFLYCLRSEEEETLKRLMRSYGYMVRFAFKRLLDGAFEKNALERKLSSDTSLSLRHAKDAVEDARQIIASQHKLVAMHAELWKVRIEQTKKKLNFYKTNAAKAERKIKALERKLEKRERKLVFWKTHEKNGTFPPVVFGGKRLFRERCKGSVSKEAWEEARNNRLCSRGDATKKGNPNLRVIAKGDEFFLQVSLDNDLNAGGKKPVYEKMVLPLYIAKKASKKTGKMNGRNYVQLMRNAMETEDAYQVEIIRKNGCFFVHITVNEPEAQIVTFPVNGYKGLDTNPDGLALCHVKPDGNALEFEWLGDGGLQDYPANKRDNLIGELAVGAIRGCKKDGTGLIVEDLAFVNDKDVSAKFNRMSHSFCYRALLEHLERAARREGVEFIKVKPAFTSVIGRLKYQPQHGVSVHQAAALAIARRGMGFQERVPKALVDLCVKQDKRSAFVKMNEWKKWSAVKQSISKKLKTKGGLVSWLDCRKELLSATSNS